MAKVMVQCENCGKEFLRYECNIHAKIFCSCKCHSLYKKGHSYKYFVNHEYFEKIDSSLKAYFLGWIVSDGHISKDGTMIEFNIHENDKYILEKFALELEEPRLPIKKHNKFSTVRMRIVSTNLIRSLNKLGIPCGKKHDIVKVPNIDEIFYKDFYRGLFDGDGSCGTSSSIIKNKRYYSFMVELYGNFDVCTSFSQFLNCPNGVYVKKEGLFRFSKRLTKYDDVLNLYNTLYSPDCFCLLRKQTRFLKYLKERKKYERIIQKNT